MGGIKGGPGFGRIHPDGVGFRRRLIAKGLKFADRKRAVPG
jgi:hypothetical protein